jgi:hypothetical protein
MRYNPQDLWNFMGGFCTLKRLFFLPSLPISIFLDALAAICAIAVSCEALA